jgi:hypothetical protein
MQIQIMAELVHIQIFYQRCAAAGALKYTQLLFAIFVMWEISSGRDGKRPRDSVGITDLSS